MTQTERVLAYLRAHPEGLTALTALDEIGTARLAARVYDLRAAGHDIDECRETTRRGARISRYFLREQGQLTLDALPGGGREFPVVDHLPAGRRPAASAEPLTR